MEGRKRSENQDFKRKNALHCSKVSTIQSSRIPLIGLRLRFPNTSLTALPPSLWEHQIGLYLRRPSSKPTYAYSENAKSTFVVISPSSLLIVCSLLSVEQPKAMYAELTTLAGRSAGFCRVSSLRVSPYLSSPNPLSRNPPQTTHGKMLDYWIAHPFPTARHYAFTRPIFIAILFTPPVMLGHKMRFRPLYFSPWTSKEQMGENVMNEDHNLERKSAPFSSATIETGYSPDVPTASVFSQDGADSLIDNLWSTRVAYIRTRTGVLEELTLSGERKEYVRRHLIIIPTGASYSPIY
jgi:hypothetical protein